MQKITLPNGDKCLGHLRKQHGNTPFTTYSEKGVFPFRARLTRFFIVCPYHVRLLSTTLILWTLTEPCSSREGSQLTPLPGRLVFPRPVQLWCFLPTSPLLPLPPFLLLSLFPVDLFVLFVCLSVLPHTCNYMHYMHVWSTPDLLKLELAVVVSCHVGAENRTQKVLWKKKATSVLATEPSFQQLLPFEKVSVCTSGWLGTHDLPTLGFWVSELLVCTCPWP